MKSLLIILTLILATASADAKIKSRADKLPDPKAVLIELINATLDSLDRAEIGSSHGWNFVDNANFPDCGKERAAAKFTNRFGADRSGKKTNPSVTSLIDRGYFQELLVYLVSYSVSDQTIKHFRVLHFNFQYLPDSLPAYHYEFLDVYRHVVIKTSPSGERLKALCVDNGENAEFNGKFRNAFDYLKKIIARRGTR